MEEQSFESEEFTALVQGMMPMAEKMLDEMGAFLPYAGVLYKDGEIRHLTIDPDTRDKHDVTEIVAALENSISQLADKEKSQFSATAVCMDIKMVPSQSGIDEIKHSARAENEDNTSAPEEDEEVDCIMFRFENTDGEALDAFRPYAIDQSGHVRFSRMFATRTETKILNENQK